MEREQMITSLVLLATGEYSDYRTEPFRVLKPFTMRAAADEFRSQWKATEDCIDAVLGLAAAEAPNAEGNKDA